MSKKTYTILFIFFSLFVLSQKYNYKNYLEDNDINIRLRKNYKNIDSLSFLFKQLKRKVDYRSFLIKAIINNEHRNKYLDTAFMLGLKPLCIEPFLNYFDSNYIKTSYQKNYLMLLNKELIKQLDTLTEKDQIYRSQMSFIHQVEKYSNKENNTNMEDKLKRKKMIDSLFVLQHKIDEDNFNIFKDILNKFGWPSSKLIGFDYCDRPAPDPAILVVHNTNLKREDKINILNDVIKLCENKEEDWGRAVEILYSIITNYGNDYQELPLIKVKENYTIDECSFFTLWHLSKLLICSPNKKILIKCNNFATFFNLRKYMISLSEVIILDDDLIETLSSIRNIKPTKLSYDRFEYLITNDKLTLNPKFKLK